MQPRGRVAVSGVDALAANDESDAATIQLADQLSEVGEGAAKAVELEADHRLKLATTHASHHLIQRLPRELRAGCMILENDCLVSPRLCHAFGVSSLRIDGLIFSRDAEVDGCFHSLHYAAAANHQRATFN